MSVVKPLIDHSDKHYVENEQCVSIARRDNNENESTVDILDITYLSVLETILTKDLPINALLDCVGAGPEYDSTQLRLREQSVTCTGVVIGVTAVGLSLTSPPHAVSD